MIGKLFDIFRLTIKDAISVVQSPVNGIRAFYGVSLYRNAVFLLLDSSITALAGFIFWTLAARLYATEGVGLTSAAISAVLLLSSVSGLGLDLAVIRFLPNARDHAHDMVNSCLTMCGAVSILVAIIFIAGMDLWTPALLPIRDDRVLLGAFVVFVFASRLAALMRAVFIAWRRASVVFIVGLVTNVLRFVPLAILADEFLTFGIFASWGIALLLGGLMAVIFLLPRLQEGYRPLPVIKMKMIGSMFHFSAANYAVNLLALASGSLLPLMVVNLLGTTPNAYFYIAWTISNMIATIPVAVNTSLFAEGSYDARELGQQVARSVKFLLVILVPLVGLLLLLADWLLYLFGAAYAENAVWLLRVLTLAALPVSVNSLYYAIKRVKGEMSLVVILNAFIAAGTLGLSYFLLPRMGVIAAGIAWLIANGLAAVFIVARWLQKRAL